MLTAKLKRGKKILAKMTLPESAAEVSLVQYISFLNEVQKMDLPGSNPVECMAKAVSEFMRIDLQQIYAAELGEAWTGKQEAITGVKAVFGWAVRALTNYKGQARNPKDFQIQYKGETYSIPFIVLSQLAGGTPLMPDISTGEAIEAYETVRTFDREIIQKGDPDGAIKKEILELKKAATKSGEDVTEQVRILEIQIQANGDPNGDLSFARYLRMLAILLKKEGERIPASDGDKERWIQERMIGFQEIDCKTALDIDFFLTGTLRRSVRTLPVIGSLIPPLFALSALTASKPMQSAGHTSKRLKGKRQSMKG